MNSDSTMAIKKQSQRPETGWGEALAEAFNAEKVIISNHAKDGRSTRTFIEQGRWDELMKQVEPKNVVFIQFGHNDRRKKKKDRYTSPEQYRTNLSKFIEETRFKKAVPVLFTPIVRRMFNENGEFFDTHGIYPEIVRAVAKEKGVALIDMHQLSADLVSSLGKENSKSLYLKDKTHLTPKGAEEITKLCIEAFRSNKKLKLHRSKLYRK